MSDAEVTGLRAGGGLRGRLTVLVVDDSAVARAAVGAAVPGGELPAGDLQPLPLRHRDRPGVSGLFLRQRSRAAVLDATALVLVAALLPFVGTFGHEFLAWDDRLLLVDNPRWREDGWLSWVLLDSAGGSFGPYQPLTWLSYRLDLALSGLDPVRFHATNVILHALSAVALLSLARAVLTAAVPALRSAPRARDGTAVLVALAWAVHPQRVEAVAWVTARRDVLAALLALLALRAW